MNKQLLIRALKEELGKSTGLSACVLDRVICIAINNVWLIDGDIEELYSELSERIVHFQYRKTDGTLREAWGTLNEKYFDKLLSGNRRKLVDNGCFCYFDLERKDWRCFRIDKFYQML